MERSRSMTISACVAASIFLLAACTPVPAEAAGRWGRRFLRPTPAAEHNTPRSAPSARAPFFAPIPPELRHDPANYYRSIHPKYQSGFHARDMQNLGVPSGDVGLRGNGMTWSPW
jgi:hypothetical protein